MRPTQFNTSYNQDHFNNVSLPQTQSQPLYNNTTASFAASLHPQETVRNNTMYNPHLSAPDFTKEPETFSFDNNINPENTSFFATDAFNALPLSHPENQFDTSGFSTAEDAIDALLQHPLPLTDLNSTFSAQSFTPALEMQPDMLPDLDVPTLDSLWNAPVDMPEPSEAFATNPALLPQQSLEQQPLWFAPTHEDQNILIPDTDPNSFPDAAYIQPWLDNTPADFNPAFAPQPVHTPNILPEAEAPATEPATTVPPVLETASTQTAEPKAASGKKRTATDAGLEQPAPGRKRRVDPITGKPSTAENAIPLSTYHKRLTVDPETGKPSNAPNAISGTAYQNRQRVDPVTGKPSNAPDAITYTTFNMRKKVDPVTGKISSEPNAIPRYMFNNKKRNKIVKLKEKLPEVYASLPSKRKVDPVTGEPSTASDAVSQTARHMRKLVDPDTGKESTAENAISRSKYYNRRKVDPETGKPSSASNAISRSQFVKRYKVDPITGQPSTASNAISQSNYYNKQKVDPDTGKRSNAPDAIPYGAYSKRRANKNKAANKADINAAA